MTYDWRCMCGKENDAKVLHCRRMKCRKQRWSQLGISFAAALILRNAILPDYLRNS